MTEDDFNPSEDDDSGADLQPRVNLSYARETAATQQALSATFLPKLSLKKDRLILFGKSILVVAIILAYPLMVMMSHKLDDSPVVFDDSRFWAVPDIGVSSILIARELDGPGWVTDRHRWHPQARLKALPAWQASLIAALADHGRLVISELGTQRDPDLIAAVRLMEPTTGEDMAAHLMAASEALSRYDDRVAGGVALAPRGAAALSAKLGLASDWADERYMALVGIASPGDGWVASTEAIESVYAAKAAAHVAHEMLAATFAQESRLLSSYEANEAAQDVLNKWRRAASLRPLLIANQSSDAVSGVNHPAIMAFRLNEALDASLLLATRLETPLPDTTTAPPASGETTKLTSN